jgi:hypothetical protein
MPEEDGEPASEVPLPPDRFGDPEAPQEPGVPPARVVPAPEVYGDPEAPPARVEPEPVAAPRPDARRTTTRPGTLGRLISVIVSVGLAWALVVAITAWLLGLFLARG